MDEILEGMLLYKWQKNIFPFLTDIRLLPMITACWLLSCVHSNELAMSRKIITERACFRNCKPTARLMSNARAINTGKMKINISW